MASLLELLLKIEVIDERQHDAVLSRAKSPAGGHIVQQIAELGHATEGTMARAIAVELGLPRVDLTATPPEPAALALLEPRICAERFVLPVALREDGALLWLAVADPTDKEAIDMVRRRTQKRVRVAVAAPGEILRAARAASALAPGGSAPESGELKTPGETRAPGEEALTLDDLLAPATIPRQLGRDDLSEEDLATLESIRVSLEKGAHILRSLALLCVEKQVFTRDEMKRRNPQ